MGYLRFFMRYLSDGLGSKLPLKSQITCFTVDLTKNPQIELDCPSGYTLYIVLPADFDDKLKEPIDWKCSDNTELIFDGQSRVLSFFTRVTAYVSRLRMIPMQNELCINTYTKGVLDLSPLAHLKEVKLYRYDYKYDRMLAELHPQYPFFGAVLDT